MEREIITIDENGRLFIPAHSVSIWMSEAELIDLFDVLCSTLRATIKAVYKSGILKKFEVEHYDQISKGCSVIRYNLQMIIALAFRIDSFGALKIREYVCHNFGVRDNPPVLNILITGGRKAEKHYSC